MFRRIEKRSEISEGVAMLGVYGLSSFSISDAPSSLRLFARLGHIVVTTKRFARILVRPRRLGGFTFRP